jgi:hypothetical protein
MSKKSVDLLSYLHKNVSLKSSTFDSLLDFGFDSNEALMALDLDLDLPKLVTISLGQRSLLRRLINEFKCNNIIDSNHINNNKTKSNNKCEKNLCESYSILSKVKTIIGFNNEFNDKKSDEKIKILNQSLAKKESLVIKYEIEAKDKDLLIKELEKKLQKKEEMFKSMAEKFENCLNENKNSLKKVKNYLLSNCDLNNDKKCESNRNESHFEITSNEEMNEWVSNKTQTIDNKDIEPIVEDLSECVRNSVPNNSRDVSLTIVPIVDYIHNNKIDCSDLNSNHLNQTSDKTNDNISYDCISFEDLSHNSKKRSNDIQIESLDSENANKKVKTDKEITSSTHIVMIALDSKDDDSQDTNDSEQNEGPIANQFIISTITASKLAIDINEDTVCDHIDNKASDLLLKQNIETNDTMSHISTSNGYLSDSNEENNCSVNTESSKGFRCHLPDCDFTTLFKLKFDDHIKNHVSYHLGQEIPQFWKPFFNEYIKSNKNCK